jgi:hypothetical protein
MTFRQMAVLSFNLVIGAAMGLPGKSRAQEALPSEYQMKAAYLYNFAKFVEWPATALPPGDSPLVFGVLGEDPFDGVLDSTIHNKTIEGHPLAVRRVKTLDDARTCQVLFISNSEKKRWPAISEALKAGSVLTVSENWDRFTEEGGMIYFFMEGRKVCFDINNDAARRAGLRISSKLLLLRKKPPA